MIGISNTPEGAEDGFRLQCHDKTLRLAVGSPIRRTVEPALDVFDLLMCMHAVQHDGQTQLNAIIGSEDRSKWRVYALGTENAIDQYLAELQRNRVDVCMIEGATREGAFMPRKTARGYLALSIAPSGLTAIGITFLGKEAFKTSMQIANGADQS